MAKTCRQNFTNEIRAQAFVLDRALCCLTGQSLWILDWGIAPDYPGDVTDHVVPCALGGDSSLENAATTGCLANQRRGADPTPAPYIVRCGMPTALWYEMEGDHAALLEFVDSKRLLHSSDWYLNRAMQDLLFATARAVYPHTFHRGASYYATAGLKMLAKWRQLVRVHRVASVEERGLCLAQPERSIDQDVLLSVREVTTLAGFEAAMVTLAPILRASDHAVARQQEAFNEGRISEFAEWLRGNRLVPALIKGRMQEDIRAESAI